MFVIGTAGHIDHGKSTLVKALTGIDPDRLPEEKEREMTIDLGFAWLTLPSGREVSVVDVPGHERFIKNMLAGVGGIDLALLVVAADEGVMPQTREHLAILDLLEVRAGVVAITKKDLVDPDWLDLVRVDVEEALKGTSLEGAPVLAVSAVTGEGLPDLLMALDRLLEEKAPRRDVGRPRLPIDNFFVLPGFGLVVRGTLLDGSLQVGQEVELVPSGQRGRIRGLQSHRRKIEKALPGRRVAVNLSGIDHIGVRRGQVLTTPGWLRPTTVVDVHLRAIRWAPHPIRHGMGVTFHSGAAETEARLRLLSAEELRPGEEGWAQVVLEEPLPVVKGDYVVLRSPQWTLGGGRVVDPFPRRHKRFHAPTLERLSALARGSPGEALLRSLEEGEPADPATLAGRANLSLDEALSLVRGLSSSGSLVALGDLGPSTPLFTVEGWERLKEKAASALEAHHRAYPLRRGLPREELRSRLGLSPSVFPAVLSRLVAEGTVREEGALVRSPTHQARLTPEQERAVQEYLRALEREPFSPPTDIPIDPDLLAYLAEEGKVVRVNAEVVFSASAYREMVERIIAHLKENGTITVAQVRDMFRTSRKYALPLLEYLDQQHITRRIGDERVLVKG